MGNAKRSSIVSILILSIFAFTFSSHAHAALIPQLEWIQTYDNPFHDYDYGYGVTVDAAGNAYVTGSERRVGQGYWNIWLRKYDTDGNTLWTETYDSPDHGSDHGDGVAVDAAGNVYVTGEEHRLGQSSNIWLRKYDTNGNTLWTQTYDNPAHDGDVGQSVAVDAAGNVYVTGYEFRDDLGQESNIWLRKYDTDGNTLWTETYDSPYHDYDYGYGVTVDAAGNAYVTGSERRDDLGQNQNIWLRKYDTDGNTLWTETYDSPSHASDVGYGVAVDAAGNVYVSGSEHRTDLGQSDNIWLRKYDTDGNTLWTETYDSPSHASDESFGVALDSAGNVYVTGREYRNDLGQNYNIWLRKYDTDGNIIWTETYDNPSHYGDEGYGVTVDAAGNVYVTGHEYRDDLGQDYDIILLKYSQPGYVAIPEPSTLLLLAPALLGFVGVALKRRK